MAELGKYCELRVIKQLDFGIYLDGSTLGEILLPIRQVPPGTKIGDTIEVFLYKDSEDRLIATSKEPYATVGEFAVLEVIEVNKVGAFLDWGLEKQLLVPFREQKQEMEKGKSYLVYVYVDYESQRIVASSKLDKFLDNVPPKYEAGQEVNLLISNQSDIGYVAIINNLHSGLIYKNEVFKPLRRGQKLKGYIKKIREDDKIDLSIYPSGFEKNDKFQQQIINELKKSGGNLSFSDKTDPQLIYERFGFSKKIFKKAIGALYKQHQIIIEDDGIRLI